MMTILLPAHTKRRLAGGELLPRSADNIFTRIIRNPLMESAVPRERQCTEMLAGLLINAPVACRTICQWLADRSNLQGYDAEVYNFSITTEVPAGSKRIDLVIEGRKVAQPNSPIDLLWIVEAKVGAAIHLSSNVMQESNRSPIQADFQVDQLQNYDSWLDARTALNKAAFLLSIQPETIPSPETKRHKWTCITWTALGCVLKDALKAGKIPTQELLLCTHVLGFIADHLWRNAEMPDAKIELEDVAFLRAWALISQETEKKLQKIVAPLQQIMNDLAVGEAERFDNNIYKTWGRCTYGRRIKAPHGQEYKLWAGACVDVGDEEMGFYVWLEQNTSPLAQKKFRELGTSLAKIRRDWVYDDNLGHWPIHIQLPFTKLLGESDQAGILRTFVQTATEDLMKAGFKELFVEN